MDARPVRLHAGQPQLAEGLERLGHAARHSRPQLQRHGSAVRAALASPRRRPAPDHAAQRLLEGQPLQARGHPRAGPRPCHRLRPDAPRHPEPGEGVLEREERRFSDGGVSQRPGRVFPSPRLRVEPDGGVLAQEGPGGGGGARERLAEDGLPLVELPADVRPGHGSAGEQERHRPAATVLDRPPRADGSPDLERREGPRHRRAGRDPPVAVRPAPDLQRPGHVGEVGLGVRPQVCGEPPDRLLESGLRPRGDREELLGATRLRGRRGRGLLQDHVRVRAPHAERADPGPPRRRARFPGAKRGVHVEGAAREVDLGVRRLEVEGGRDLTVLHAEHGLDQARDPGGGVEVSDVGLHRPRAQKPRRAVFPRKAFASAATSAGSPSSVPVPWAST